MKATLTEKLNVAEPEDHDRTRGEEFDSGEAPCPTSDEDDSDEEEADSSDGEGAGATINYAKFREKPSKCFGAVRPQKRRFPLKSFIAHTTVSHGHLSRID